MFVALGIQNAMHMRHVVICGLPGLKSFPRHLANGTIFKNKNIEYVCFDFLYNFCLKHFSF